MACTVEGPPNDSGGASSTAKFHNICATLSATCVSARPYRPAQELVALAVRAASEISQNDRALILGRSRFMSRLRRAKQGGRRCIGLAVVQPNLAALCWRCYESEAFGIEWSWTASGVSDVWLVTQAHRGRHPRIRWPSTLRASR